MALVDEIIAYDPVVARAFLDSRRMAPTWGHEALVNTALHRVSELKVLLQKAKSFEQADQLARQIRRFYFLARRHSEGYFAELTTAHTREEHINAFRHRPNSPELAVDEGARFRCLKRFGTPPHRGRRSRRAQTV